MIKPGTEALAERTKSALKSLHSALDRQKKKCFLHSYNSYLRIYTPDSDLNVRKPPVKTDMYPS